MQIDSVEFIASVYKPEQVPARLLPEVAFFGRSNVGKSTLINGLLGKKIARTSSTPGKTQCLNYYLVNDRFYLVDAPGYGYAKTSKKLRDAWQKNLEAWMIANDRLKMSFLIVDGRIEIQASDLQMAEFLNYCRLSTTVLVNKMDKLKNKERLPALKTFESGFSRQRLPIIPSSGLTGEGRDAILNVMKTALN